MTVLRDIAVGWKFNLDKTDLFALERLLQRAQRGFMAMGAAGALAFKTIFGTSLQFEDSLARVTTMVNLTGSDLDNLRHKYAQFSKDMSEKFGVGFAEIHEDMRNVLNLGIDPLSNGFYELVDVINKLKKVGESDPLKTSRAIFKAHTAWPEMSYSEIADQLFIASKTAPAYVEELAGALEKGTPAGVLFNQTLKEVLGTLSVFSTMSVSGPQAGTRLFSGMSLLTSDAGRAKKGLESLGLTVASLVKPDGSWRNFSDIFKVLRERMTKLSKANMTMALVNIFGRRVGNAYVSVLYQKHEILTKMIEVLEKGGQLEGAFVERMSTGTQKINQFKSAFANLLASIDINKALGQLATNMGIIVGNLRTLLDNSPVLKTLTADTIGFGLAIITLTGIFGFFSTSILLLQAAFKRLGYTAAKTWGVVFFKPLLMAAGLILLLLLLENIILEAEGAAGQTKWLAETFDMTASSAAALNAVLWVAITFLVGLVSIPLLIAIGFVVLIATIWEAYAAFDAWVRNMKYLDEDDYKWLTNFNKALDLILDNLDKLNRFGEEHLGLLWKIMFFPIKHNFVVYTLELLNKAADKLLGAAGQPDGGIGAALMENMAHEINFPSGTKQYISNPDKKGRVNTIIIDQSGKQNNYTVSSEEAAVKLTGQIAQLEMNEAWVEVFMQSVAAEVLGDTVTTETKE